MKTGSQVAGGLGVALGLEMKRLRTRLAPPPTRRVSRASPQDRRLRYGTINSAALECLGHHGEHTWGSEEGHPAALRVVRKRL